MPISTWGYDAMPDNPEQKKRRWPLWLGLIVSVVVVAAGITSLILPGKIDPRLVGEWKYNEIPDAGFLLMADGSFVKVMKGKPLWGPRHALWSVQGNRIVVNYCHANPVGNLLVQVHELYSQATGRPVPLGLERFDLLDVQPDAMSVRYIGMHNEKSQWTLQRVNGM